MTSNNADKGLAELRRLVAVSAIRFVNDKDKWVGAEEIDGGADSYVELCIAVEALERRLKTRARNG